MAQALGLKIHSGDAVVDYLIQLNEKIGIPRHLRDIGMKKEHLDALADLAIADFAHPNNPKPVSRRDFRALYEEAF